MGRLHEAIGVNVAPNLRHAQMFTAEQNNRNVLNNHYLVGRTQ